MTVQECYDRMGADYRGVMSRVPKETMVIKYLHRLLEEEAFKELSEAMKQGQMQNAFQAAHAIKGMGLNLGLTRLVEAAGRLTEELRAGERTEKAIIFCGEVYREYGIMEAAVKELGE